MEALTFFGSLFTHSCETGSLTRPSLHGRLAFVYSGRERRLRVFLRLHKKAIVIGGYRNGIAA
jgi:hypothetical protein